MAHGIDHFLAWDEIHTFLTAEDISEIENMPEIDQAGAVRTAMLGAGADPDLADSLLVRAGLTDI